MTQATTVEFPGVTAGMGWVRGVQMKRDTAPEGITGRTGGGPSARGSHGQSGRRPAAPRGPSADWTLSRTVGAGEPQRRKDGAEPRPAALRPAAPEKRARRCSDPSYSGAKGPVA